MRRTVIRRLAISAALLLLAGCGPSVDRAFANCADAAYKLALSGNKSLLPKDAAQIFEKAARATAEQQCSFIRDECRRDGQSDECKHLIQQYGN